MKTVQNVKNSLKFKINPKVGALTVRVGVKKFVLPLEARVMSGGDYLFLSFPSCSEIFEIRDGKKLEMMAGDADGGAVDEALTVKKAGRANRKKGAVEMPEALAAALRAVPAGHKLVLGADGSYRLTKTRNRSKKG